MAKGAASEGKLAGLHDLLADVLIEQVSEKAKFEDPETGLSNEVYTASPALLTVAKAFLKENEVTCQPEEGNKTNNLREKLKQRGLATVTHLKEQEHG